MLRRHDPRRCAGAVAGLLALTLTLSACGGDPEDEKESAPTPSVSVTPTPTESPTESPAPKPPKPPRAAATPAARTAFARFVVETWGYTLSTNDARPMVGLSAGRRPCQGCRELQTELATRKKQGWYVDFPGARVKRVTVAPGGAPATWLANVVIDIPKSRSYFDDGTFRNDNEAHKGATFQLRMQLVKKRYALLAFQVG